MDQPNLETATDAEINLWLAFLAVKVFQAIGELERRHPEIPIAGVVQLGMKAAAESIGRSAHVLQGQANESGEVH